MNENGGQGTGCKVFLVSFPPQHQKEQPELEYLMKPLPVSECCKLVEGSRTRLCCLL